MPSVQMQPDERHSTLKKLRNLQKKGKIWRSRVRVSALHGLGANDQDSNGAEGRNSASLKKTDWTLLRERDTSISRRNFNRISENRFKDEKTRGKIAEWMLSFCEKHFRDKTGKTIIDPKDPTKDMIATPSGPLLHLLEQQPQLKKEKDVQNMLGRWCVELTGEPHMQNIYLKESTLSNQTADPCLQNKDPTRIELGGFASTRIAAGDFITEYVGIIGVEDAEDTSAKEEDIASQDLNSQQINQMEETSKAAEYQCEVIIQNLCAVIDAAEEGNEASFINTNDPAKVNAIFVPVVYNGRIHVLVVAVKSIEEDEEIFVDYGPFYREYRAKLARAKKHQAERRAAQNSASEANSGSSSETDQDREFCVASSDNDTPDPILIESDDDDERDDQAAVAAVADEGKDAKHEDMCHSQGLASALDGNLKQEEKSDGVKGSNTSSGGMMSKVTADDSGGSVTSSQTAGAASDSASSVGPTLRTRVLRTPQFEQGQGSSTEMQKRSATAAGLGGNGGKRKKQPHELLAGSTVEALYAGCEKRKAIITAVDQQRQAAYALQWADGDCAEKEHWKTREQLVPLDGNDTYLKAVLDSLVSNLEHGTLPSEAAQAQTSGEHAGALEEGAGQICQPEDLASRKVMADVVETLKSIRPASSTVFSKALRAFEQLQSAAGCSELADAFCAAFQSRTSLLAPPGMKRAVGREDVQGKGKRKRAQPGCLLDDPSSRPVVRKLCYVSSTGDDGRAGRASQRGSSSEPKPANPTEAEALTSGGATASERRKALLTSVAGAAAGEAAYEPEQRTALDADSLTRNDDVSSSASEMLGTSLSPRGVGSVTSEASGKVQLQPPQPPTSSVTSGPVAVSSHRNQPSPEATLRFPPSAVETQRRFDLESPVTPPAQAAQSAISTTDIAQGSSGSAPMCSLGAGAQLPAAHAPAAAPSIAPRALQQQQQQPPQQQPQQQQQQQSVPEQGADAEIAQPEWLAHWRASTSASPREPPGNSSSYAASVAPNVARSSLQEVGSGVVMSQPAAKSQPACLQLSGVAAEGEPRQAGDDGVGGGGDGTAGVCSCDLMKLFEQKRSSYTQEMTQAHRETNESIKKVSEQLKKKEQEIDILQDSLTKLSSLTNRALASACEVELRNQEAECKKLEALIRDLAAHAQHSEWLVRVTQTWSCPCNMVAKHAATANSLRLRAKQA